MQAIRTLIAFISPGLKHPTETLLDRPLSYEWETMGEFFDYLESSDGLLFNTVQLVGHGALHLAAVQDYTKRPNSRHLLRLSKNPKIVF